MNIRRELVLFAASNKTQEVRVSIANHAELAADKAQNPQVKVSLDDRATIELRQGSDCVWINGEDFAEFKTALDDWYGKVSEEWRRG